MRILAIVLMAAAAFGQTAKVVQLKPEEAAKAKQLHEAVIAAQKASDDYDQKIREKYINTVVTVIQCSACAAISPEWSYGFEYSEDYRFIVPKPYQKTAPPTCSPLMSFGSLTTSGLGEPR